MAEEIELTEKTLEAMRKTRESVMDIADNPFSPINRQLNLTQDVPLISRQMQDGLFPFIKAGSYPLMEGMTLGYFDFSILREEIDKLTNEAEKNGVLSVTEEDGTITQFIGNETQVNLDGMRRAVKEILINDKAVSVAELLASATVNNEQNEEARNYYLAELFDIQPKRKTPRGKGYVKTNFTQSPNDSVTNALFGRDKESILPADYFSELPKKIKTGKDIFANVLIANDFELDAAAETYRLDAYDRFWFEKVCTIALEGRTEITGSEILKLAGYKNPNQKTAVTVMTTAARSIDKMRRTSIAIDTTNERAGYMNKRGGRLIRDISLKHVIDCTLRLEEYEDGTHDFTLVLRPDEGQSPITALPLMQYAKDKGQILELPQKVAAFEGPEKVSTNVERRVMWDYIRRRLMAKNQKNTILLETVFKNMDLEDAPKKKKDQLKLALKKMLRNAKAGGEIAGYTWRDEGTTKEAIIITPIEKN